MISKRIWVSNGFQALFQTTTFEMPQPQRENPET
jgi:hypothetical protein